MKSQRNAYCIDIVNGKFKRREWSSSSRSRSKSGSAQQQFHSVRLGSGSQSKFKLNVVGFILSLSLALLVFASIGLFVLQRLRGPEQQKRTKAWDREREESRLGGRQLSRQPQSAAGRRGLHGGATPRPRHMRVPLPLVQLLLKVTQAVTFFKFLSAPFFFLLKFIIIFYAG